MYLPDFDYYAPKSVEETCRLLAEFGSKAKILAGGTDLLHKMKHGESAPEIIISLNQLKQLTSISYENDKGIVLGTRVTQNSIAQSELLQEKYPALCEAAHHMANNQIRNIGTIGGNIVNAVPSADLPPVLIALNASIKLISIDGERIMPLENFYLGVHQSVIMTEELLTEVIIPDQSTTGSAYIRFGLRKSGALAVVSVAAAVTVEANILKDVRIVLGSAAPVPMRAVETEQFLKGKEISNELLEEAGVLASQEAKPRSSIRGSEEYRRDLIRVLTRRALKQAANL